MYYSQALPLEWNKDKVISRKKVVTQSLSWLIWNTETKPIEIATVYKLLWPIITLMTDSLTNVSLKVRVVSLCVTFSVSVVVGWTVVVVMLDMSSTHGMNTSSKTDSRRSLASNLWASACIVLEEMTVWTKCSVYIVV